MEDTVEVEGGKEGLVFVSQPFDAEGAGGGREEANSDQTVGGNRREGGRRGGREGGGVRHAQENAMLEGKGGNEG